MKEFPKIALRALARRKTSGPHPEADLLAAFRDHALAEGERRQVLAHLAGCGDCRRLLYLSVDASGEEQKVLAVSARRWPRMRLLWGTVVASVALVAAATLARYELFPAHRPSAPASHQATSEYAKLSEEKVLADLDRPHGQAAMKKDLPAAPAKVLPEAKHMEAKPQASLYFEQSGEVHVVAPQPSRQAGARKLERPEVRPPDDLASASRDKAREIPPKEEAMRDAEVDSAMNELAQVPAAAPRAARVAPKPMALGKAAAGVVNMRNDAATDERVVVSRVVPLYQWTLSPGGAVERSADQGKTWHLVTARPGVQFRALCAVGADVWVGGGGGSLYHSSDSGESWEKVVPIVDGRQLEGEVIRIEFSDHLNGTVTTAGGELWETSDGGQSWRHG